jgi:hypothetical protein
MKRFIKDLSMIVFASLIFGCNNESVNTFDQETTAETTKNLTTSKRDSYVSAEDAVFVANTFMNQLSIKSTVKTRTGKMENEWFFVEFLVNYTGTYSFDTFNYSSISSPKDANCNLVSYYYMNWGNYGSGDGWFMYDELPENYSINRTNVYISYP